MTSIDGRDVFVETHGRLHFGVLDLRGSLGRWFGGVGAPAPGATLLLSACRAKDVRVEADDEAVLQRAESFANEFLAFHDIHEGVRLRLHRMLPRHSGLGSGTQLALAVGRAIAELYGITADAAALARALGRSRRSAIGTWTFAAGGLVVEGGRRHGTDGTAPLIARLPFPPSWRCLVAVPKGLHGINGAAEAAAFAGLPPPPQPEVERVAHLVLMALLPALAESDLKTFGEALTAIQLITGRWFASVQGGAFAAGPGEELIRRMSEWGATGVGQSSWGPAVFGVVDGDEPAARLADRVRAFLEDRGQVYAGAFPVHGAQVWRA